MPRLSSCSCALLCLVVFAAQLPQLQAAARVPTVARLAIVIDDIGREPGAELPFMKLSTALTFAILPQYNYSRSSALMLALAGHDILLHVPMEPLNRQAIDGPAFLTTAQTQRRFAMLVSKHLETIPGLIGCNIHMGSRLSQNTERMKWLISACNRRNLLFLDSKTIHSTVGYRVALQLGGLALIRDVFLDNQRTQSAIMGQLRRAAQLAERRGWAIAIGHPYPETLAALRQWLKSAPKRVMIVPLSQLARSRWFRDRVAEDFTRRERNGIQKMVKPVTAAALNSQQR